MKKLLFTAWLLMLSMVATAQSFVVVDKNGNRKAFDVSKLDSVTFQQDPPAFTVYENKQEEAATPSEGGGNPGSGTDPAPDEPDQEVTTFAFDEVQSLAGNPDFLFSHPDTVYVDADGQDFSFQLRTNVRYGCTPSADWLAYKADVENTDSLLFAAAMNPMTAQRIGYLYFASSDDTMRDTLVVVQLGKPDSRYIAIDWTTTTLDSFDETSGKAQLTFTGDVPVMGDYDVVLLPQGESQIIRLIDKVAQPEGSKTVTLDTREGKMGNLFKNQHFKLDTDPSAGSRTRQIAGYGDDVPVYTPVKIEVFNGVENIEIFNANSANARGNGAPVTGEKDFLKKEFNADGSVLWDGGNKGTLSWEKLNFDIGLKGLFEFDFGDKPFEKVKMGDLKNLKMALEGGFNTEAILNYTVSVGEGLTYKKTIDLLPNVIPTVTYTFMIGTVPLPISVGADLKADVELGASGELTIKGGAKASASVRLGVEWDEDNGVSKIAECEKNIELVGPTLDAKVEAKAMATAYPEIGIAIYKVLCPTISPTPYIKAEAHAQKVEDKVAWDAGLSTGIDLGLGLSLDLFFWEWELADIDPVNVFDFPLVKVPDAIELTSESPRQMLKNQQMEVKYHVTNKNYITGTEYNAPGMLVKFEAEGGELQDEYAYTDTEGNVSALFTLTDDVNGGKVKAEVVVPTDGDEDGDEGGNAGDDEEGIKADDWEAEGVQYRLTPEPAEQTIAKDAESAAITFKLEQYASKTKAWKGVAGKTIYFEAKGGSCNASGVTTADGIATATFTPEADFKEGSVTGTVTLNEPGVWSGIATGNVMAEEDEPGGETITDEGLKKAAKQKENVYVIENKKTGESQERSYVTKWSEWNKDQDFVSFSLEDADANGGTLGMIWGHVPLRMTDVVLALTGEQFANSPGGKFGFGVYEGTQLSAEFACFTGEQGMDVMGNIKPESKIMLRKISSQSANGSRRAPDGEEYAGNYELLFYLVFKNEVYNHETQQMEEGDDYEVYGRGTMKMHIPVITSMNLSSESQYLKVGESTKVNVDGYYEDGAQWDWSDVQIAGQSADYSAAYDGADEGFFTWDAATQTLTSVKPNDNKSVYVVFSLKSRPSCKSAITIATGEGWKYTSFKVGPEEQEVGSGYCSYYVEDWAPRDSEDEKFDDAAIEIDPASDPEGNFRYVHYNGRYDARLYVYRSDAAPGEYNLRFRLKSDHSVGCTMKITITSGNE